MTTPRPCIRSPNRAITLSAWSIRPGPVQRSRRDSTSRSKAKQPQRLIEQSRRPTPVDPGWTGSFSLRRVRQTIGSSVPPGEHPAPPRRSSRRSHRPPQGRDRGLRPVVGDLPAPGGRLLDRGQVHAVDPEPPGLDPLLRPHALRIDRRHPRRFERARRRYPAVHRVRHQALHPLPTDPQAAAWPSTADRW